MAISEHQEALACWLQERGLWGAPFSENKKESIEKIVSEEQTNTVETSMTSENKTPQQQIGKTLKFCFIIAQTLTEEEQSIFGKIINALKVEPEQYSICEFDDYALGSENYNAEHTIAWGNELGPELELFEVKNLKVFDSLAKLHFNPRLKIPVWNYLKEL